MAMSFTVAGDWEAMDDENNHRLRLVRHNGEIVGGVLRHNVKGTEDTECEPGLIQWEPIEGVPRPLFERNEQRGEPLSLTPFVRCEICGDAGWIIKGQWHPKTDEEGIDSVAPMRVLQGTEGDDEETFSFEEAVRRDLGDKVPDEERDADRKLYDMRGGRDTVIPPDPEFAEGGEEAVSAQERIWAKVVRQKLGDPSAVDARDIPQEVKDALAVLHKEAQRIAEGGSVFEAPDDEPDPEMEDLLAEEDDFDGLEGGLTLHPHENAHDTLDEAEEQVDRIVLRRRAGMSDEDQQRIAQEAIERIVGKAPAGEVESMTLGDWTDFIKRAAAADAPTAVNEMGGKQSDTGTRFDLIDPKALFSMAAVLDYGAKKYGADNWRAISVHDHINHAIMHAYAWLDGDTSDDHLGHFLCRAMFAQAVELQGGPDAGYGKHNDEGDN